MANLIFYKSLFFCRPGCLSAKMSPCCSLFFSGTKLFKVKLETWLLVSFNDRLALFSASVSQLAWQDESKHFAVGFTNGTLKVSHKSQDVQTSTITAHAVGVSLYYYQ